VHVVLERKRSLRSKRIWREAAWLAVVACGLAAASWALRPDRLPLLATSEQYELDLPVPLMDLDRAMLVYDEGSHLFVDTRDIDPVQDPRIPGAFVIRQASFDDDLIAVSDFLYPEDPLVLYGSGNLQEVAALASRFLERGYEQVFIMSGGIDAWRQAGGAVTAGVRGGDG
jgi:rhodanese-related sulfurtransferase